ncbi:ATP-binding protein, partial [Thermodesulfobacteriota bacterium]
SLAYDDFIQGITDYNIEYRVVRPDGSIRWVWDRAFPIKDGEGRLRRVAGLAQDITQRKVDQEGQRLLNQEIKHFAYIISHDQRAPLINLKGFCAEMEEALVVIGPATRIAMDTLPSEERAPLKFALEEDIPECLQFIRSSVSRMDRLINAILKLSRLGRAELRFEPIDMAELVGETLQTLAHQISRSGIQVSFGPLPNCLADRTAMEQVTANLLTNAINYLDPKRPGEIEIQGEKRSEETVYHIRDNGVGIAKADLDKVFEVFQRVGGHDVPGEGMGLAYVRTLIRRHGGRIRCESEPGRGCTFTFTISNSLTGGAPAL